MPRYLAFGVDGQLLTDISRDTAIPTPEIQTVIIDTWPKEKIADLAVKEITGAAIVDRDEILQASSAVESFLNTASGEIETTLKAQRQQWLEENYPENLVKAVRLVLTAGKIEPK